MNQLKQLIYFVSIKHKIIANILKQQGVQHEEQQKISKLNIAQYALFNNRWHCCVD